MPLTSIRYIAFVLGMLILALVVGRRRRWLVLLIASYVYYATWKVPYLLLVLVGVTLVSFLCGILIGRESREPHKRRTFWLGIALCLAPLIVLKYSSFLSENASALASMIGFQSNLPAAPLFGVLGVSFYVLQALSYLLDVRDGIIVAERKLGHYALYLAFFPKLLQGPIERAENLLPQLREMPATNMDDLAAGVQLVFWGIFQKTVIADRLAPFVAAVFDNTHAYAGVPVLVAIYLFAAQVYFDFAGYTDMALGVGRLFGIRLTPNFNSPYLATSVAEFWRRWHVSFSSWLLDYIFRPLQLGLRDWRTWGTPMALLITFLVSGLWHGATWGFVMWGILHGVYLGAAVFWRQWQKPLHKALRLTGSPLLRVIQVAVTFHSVCLAWIFFRATTLRAAFEIFGRLVSEFVESIAELSKGQQVDSLLFLDQGRGEFLLAVALVGMGALLRPLFRKSLADTFGEKGTSGGVRRLTWLRAVVYAVMIYMIVFLGTAVQSFIYQQF